MNEDTNLALEAQLSQADSTVTQTTSPETEQIPALARHADPSRTRNTAVEAAPQVSRRTVVWVRPSELMSQAAASASGRGIDFQAELARRARRLPAQTVTAGRRALSRRGDRLPPVTAFGQHGPSAPVTRPGIGLR